MTSNNEKVNKLSILKPAVNQTAFLKAGILGFAGSGKTFTAARLARGLAKEISNDKPVAFFDTETGSDFLIRSFEEAGIELLVAKTRSFKDLLQFMREVQETCSVAIIDSISHVWIELLEAFQRRLGRKNGLYFQDWGAIKGEWRQFTDLYVNARCHTILCGRAAFEYDYEQNETGKKELIKTGTKMRAETEMGYEPSLLLEMERVKKPDDKGWINRCYVLKDRTNLMNGAEIDYPSYESFKPVIKFLNIGGDHLGVDTSRVSDDLFDKPETSISRYGTQIEITLEEIKNLFVKGDLDGSAAATKRARLGLLEEVFGTGSWTAIENMSLKELKAGKEIMESMDLDEWRVNYLKSLKEEKAKPKVVGE